MPQPSEPPIADDQFAARIQAEIAAAAEERRRESPELARLEREIERQWADIAPPGAGGGEELLLDRVERLAMVDVDAPVGSKPGIRQVKGAIRKGTYWYLRYVTDQLNAFHNVQARLLRRMDERLARLEDSAGLSRSVDALVGDAPVAGAGCGAALLEAAGGDGRVLVAAAGAGDSLAPFVGHRVAYGVEADAQAALSGIDAGLDLRVGDPLDHLHSLETDTLGAVLAGGSLQRCAPAAALALVQAMVRVCAPGGVAAVAVEDRSGWTTAERELLAGRGLAPDTWATLLAPLAVGVESVAVDDPGIERLVIARLP
ncbi:MAG: class I SAM-dependent methyltransferase [Acidimicrobiales bacterium]|nr:class I SAM-dependent methyltransferase [Acidimicrobiales bacterium]